MSKFVEWSKDPEKYGITMADGSKLRAGIHSEVTPDGVFINGERRNDLTAKDVLGFDPWEDQVNLMMDMAERSILPPLRIAKIDHETKTVIFNRETE